ncbi:MAG: hypothetical protein ABH832_02415 [bacterium]
MKKIILTIAFLIALSPFAVSAANLNDALGNLQTATKQTGVQSGSFSSLDTAVGSIIKTALSLVGTIFLVLMVYSGILWMTAQGKEEQVEKAVKIIKASIVGLFIVMSAYAITYFVTTRMGAAQTTPTQTPATATKKP